MTKTERNKQISAVILEVKQGKTPFIPGLSVVLQIVDSWVEGVIGKDDNPVRDILRDEQRTRAGLSTKGGKENE